MTDRKRFWIFILVAFGGGWLLMGLGMLLGIRLFQTLVALAMLMPLLGVILSHGGLKYAKTGIHWEPRIKGHGRWYILAWFGPAAVTLVCAVLFYLVIPSRFDPTFGYLTAQLGEYAELFPYPMSVLAVIQLIQAVTYAPFLNMILAVGEESGWRGYMTPYLSRRFGRVWGLLLSGVIWAVWHWPLILLAGYEYGAGYFGAPFTGMLVMCLFTTALGILFSWLYDRSESIWVPALAHGALNAAAGLGVLVLNTDVTSLILGPTPAGLLAGIPLFILALLVLLRKK